jgi:hypothetical protein
VIVPVSIIFTVGLVVLLVIADRIVEGKTIVSRDKIDAVVGCTSVGVVKIGAAGQPGGQGTG